MGRKDKARLILAALLLLSSPILSAQTPSGQTDSLVRLMKAQSIELIEQMGQNYRKAIDATFLHNGTYLICDTALWNVESKTINCWGNVKLMQEDTELTSDKLDYLVDDNLAQFRGNLVQLRNKKDNILRTRFLDYNTRDSIAVFRDGASMRDKDGQIIESDNGTYESGRKFFTFSGNVNMFTDSVFVKTSNLTYDTDRNMAGFVSYVDFWKDDNMLSAGHGWYDHNSEIFFFNNDVHGLTTQQECWSDSLYFYRNTQNVRLLGNAQVQDTTRSIAALANFIFYEDSVSRVTMRRDAAVAMITNQNDKVDTLYVGSDDLTYWTTRMCDIPESEVSVAKTRLGEILGDPVREYRKKAAEAAAEAAAKAKEEMEGQNGKPKAAKPQNTPQTAPADTASTPADTAASPDSLMFSDTLAVLPPPDTTKKGFLKAVGRVRMFRKDMQVACDSLRYCDLDSIARLYKDPIVWNEGNRQYTSDSLFVLVKDGGVDRASLMSNAFIITQEDSICFDQIKGTDVVAYFDEESNLSRFDALGGASALFYLKENDAFATINRVESKMLSANLADGELQRVYYFDSPSNDAYPIVQLPEDERRMKGFNWQPDDRPKSKEDITPLEMRASQRRAFEAHPRATFKHTDEYFPGYMDSVYKAIEEARLRKEAAAAASDSTAAQDSLGVRDTLAIGGELGAVDSLAAGHPTAIIDTLGVASDSLAVKDSLAVEVPDSVESVVDKRQERREAQELARSLKIAHRDARWAELDAKDAAKAEAKAAKKLERKRKATRKALVRQAKQDARDAAKLEKYRQIFEKQKARKGEPKIEDNEGPEVEELPAAD